MIKILLLAVCLLCLCDARSESRDGYSGSRGSSGDSRVTRSGSSGGKRESSKRSGDGKKRSSSSRKTSRNSDRDSQKGSGSRDGASYGSGGSGGSKARGEHAPAPEKDQVCCLKDGAPSSVSCGAGGTSYCDSSYCVLVDGDQCPTSAPTDTPTEQPSVQPTAEPTTTTETTTTTESTVVFVNVNTGRCGDVPGRSAILDIDECALAAGKERSQVDVLSEPNYPPGCLTLFGNPIFNTASDSTAELFGNPNSGFQCVCKQSSNGASQLSVGGVTVARWVSPFEMAMEDQNLVYLAAAAAMATLAVVFYGCSRKEANKKAVYEELV